MPVNLQTVFLCLRNQSDGMTGVTKAVVCAILSVGWCI